MKLSHHLRSCVRPGFKGMEILQENPRPWQQKGTIAIKQTLSHQCTHRRLQFQMIPYPRIYLQMKTFHRVPRMIPTTKQANIVNLTNLDLCHES